jgi:hypothetical protein
VLYKTCRVCGANESADDEMKKLALPILPDQPETVDEVVYTWNIEGWSQLPRKAHSPVFQAGEQPW